MHKILLPLDVAKLLIIGMVWPEPQSSAAGTRMLQLIVLFQKLNYEITFASAAQESEFSFDLTTLHVKKQTIALNCSSFEEFLSNLNPKIVLFDRYIIEEQFSWRVSEVCPNAIRILDSEDLHCLRLERQKAVKNQQIFEITDLLVSDFAKREIASIYRCDITLIVSDFEMEILKDTFKIAESLLHYLPLFYKNNDTKTDANFEQKQDFVFIGNFLHEPNYDAVKQLKQVIWPLIRKELPTIKLNIYGAYPSQKVLQLHNPKENFLVHGRAESAKNVMEKAKILLAPIRFGAGLKGKLLEAMSLGTPIITTTIGAEGIFENVTTSVCITDDFNDFTTQAVKMYNKESIWSSEQEKNWNIVQEKFDSSVFETNFKEKINNLHINIKEHRKSNFIGSLLQYHLNLSTKYMSRWIEEKNKKAT